jgi:VCBS repeat-containing protein
MGSGDDWLDGGAGDDQLDGGAGADVAIFSGARRDYSVVANLDGSLSVIDLRSGSPDGADTLTAIETLRFADGDVPAVENRAPTADNLATGGTEDDAQVTGQVTGSDLDGNALTFALAVGPATGNLVFGSDGSFTYTPAADANGDVSFTFTANDGMADSLPGTVTISLAPVNDPATFSGLTAQVAESADKGGISTVKGTVTVTDIDSGTGLTVITQGTYGQLVLGAGGTFTYTLDNAQAAVDALSAGETKTDTITLRSEDGTQADLVVAINGANDVRTGADGVNDNLVGTGGVDTLDGRSGDDVLTGLAGNDMLIGGAGKDKLFGGDGADTLDGGADNDSLDGGNGIDTVTYAVSALGVTVNLTTGVATFASGGEKDTLVSIENVTGSAKADSLTGSTSGNRLEGGAGNDIIAGGGDADILLGGAGKDTFVYSLLTDSGGSKVDTILDFNSAEGDRISLVDIDAIAGTKANEAFSFNAGGVFSHKAGELIATYVTDHYVVQGDINGDGVADFMISVFSATPLTKGDFIL